MSYIALTRYIILIDRIHPIKGKWIVFQKMIGVELVGYKIRIARRYEIRIFIYTLLKDLKKLYYEKTL